VTQQSPPPEPVRSPGVTVQPLPTQQSSTSVLVVTVLVFCLLAAGGGFAAGTWWRGRPAAGPAGGGQFPPVQVSLAPVRSTALPVVVDAVGTVHAAESVELTVRTAGTIARLDLPEGAEVKAGTVLVQLDAEAALAQVREAEARQANAKRELALAEGLLTRGVGTADNLAQRSYQVAVAETQLAQAQARRDDLRIVAPFAGRLGLRQVSPGALVTPGTVVSTLVQDDAVKVAFAVPERHLGRLRASLAVQGRTAAHPGRVFAGTLTAVDTAVDPATRAVTVHAALPNPDHALRAGMFLDVELVIDEIVGALLVPEEAVMVSGNQASVFVIAGGVAEGRPVRLGARRRGEVQVIDGLKAGEQVAVRGLQFLRPGAKVATVEDPAVGAVPPGAKPSGDAAKPAAAKPAAAKRE